MTSALPNAIALRVFLVFFPFLVASAAELPPQEQVNILENEHVCLMQSRSSLMKPGPRQVLSEAAAGTFDALIFAQTAVEVSSAETVEEVSSAETLEEAPAAGEQPSWLPAVNVDQPPEDEDMTCSLEGLTPGVCAMKTLARVEVSPNRSSDLDFVNPERLERALFQEIEAALAGTHNGFSADHLQLVEEELGAIFAALPKNEAGLLDHNTVRYAVHQRFLRKHAWYIRSLNPMGEAQTPVSASEALRGHVPEHLQRLIEKREDGRGLGLRELSALTITLEHLIDGDLAERLKAVYITHDLEYRQPASRSDVSEVLETYMAHLLSLKHRNGYAVSAEQSRNELRYIASSYAGWPGVVAKIQEAMASRAPEGPWVMLPFSDAVSAANEVVAKFQQSTAQECQGIKQDLSAMTHGATGLVLATDFHKKALEGGMLFSESTEYLGLLGALDENEHGFLSVLVPNYVYSPSNCLGTTSFLDMCCPNECERIMAQLEARLGRPDASPAGVKEVIMSIGAEGPLSEAALEDLDALAQKHDGHVSLHSYLFSEWLHRAFPMECPRLRVEDFAGARHEAEVPARESEFQAIAQLPSITSSESDLMLEVKLAEEEQLQQEARDNDELPEFVEPPANASKITGGMGSGLRIAELKTMAAEKVARGGLKIPSAFDVASLAQTRLESSAAVSSSKGGEAAERGTSGLNVKRMP